MTRWDGTTTYKSRVQEFFAAHENEWLTPREVAEATDMTTPQARGAMDSLVHDDFLIRGTRGKSGEAGDRRTIQRTFRTKRGYMQTSRFSPRPLLEMIWVGEDPIPGPFCQHCGNPQYAHGPELECLNYRIHPLLPLGDLPLAS